MSGRPGAELSLATMQVIRRLSVRAPVGGINRNWDRSGLVGSSSRGPGALVPWCAGALVPLNRLPVRVATGHDEIGQASWAHFGHSSLRRCAQIGADRTRPRAQELTGRRRIASLPQKV